MQAYTELIPPTGVTHAAALPFLSRAASSLVLAKTSVLDILSLRPTADHGQSRLDLVASYPLSGTVTALRAVTLPTTKSGGDALLIAFKDAKLSLVEWDPENHRISTISIHYYEGDSVVLPPFGPSLSDCPSILTVDPSSRCAALKFGPRQLAVLPFRQQGDDLGGEDGLDAEMEDAPPLKRTQTGVSEAADGADTKQTPYEASFVLPLTALDPSLAHPVDLGFLHEYREPTLGILGAAQQASTALLDERKDALTYSVFTLDLEQRASTNLVSVPKLPSDLWKVVPLPLPVGGALLVGTNELIHVDQSGKTNAVAVNEFAQKASNLNMIDQSHLNMRLENCQVEALDSRGGDLLLVTEGGALAVLAFKLSGRSVGGLDVTKVDAESGGQLLNASPSSMAALNGRAVFVGTEAGDSVLLKWSKSTSTLSRKRSLADMLGQERAKDDDDSDESGDDDLYGEATQSKKRSMSSSAQTSATYQFQSMDRLARLGTISSFCFGRSKQAAHDKLQMVAGVGYDRASRLAFLSRSVVPAETTKQSFEQVKDAWYLNLPQDKSSGESEGCAVFVYDGEATKIYNVSDDTKSPVERTETEFEGEGETLFIGMLAGGSRVVHCRRNEVRTYDSADLSLDAIVPQESDDTDAELKIVHTSFCDPYALILRDDSSVQILKADEKGDVEPLELDASIKSSKWTSGCLYQTEAAGNATCAYLLAEDGSLNVYAASNFGQVYKAPILSQLPPVLTQDASQRRFGVKETLSEILMADLGPAGLEKPVLVVRSAMDDLTLYEPFLLGEDGQGQPSMEHVRFRKMPFTYLPKYDETAAAEDTDGRPAPLKAITIGDLRTIVVPGPLPTLILKEAHSLPQALAVQTSSKTRTLVPVQRDGSRCFALIDAKGVVTRYELAGDEDYSTGWAVRKLALGDPVEEVRHVDFHEEKGMYVVATCRDVDFYFAPEDNRHEAQDDIALRPQVPQYTLHLLSAATHNVIHSLPMPYLETITSMRVMPLEISEHTHEQRPLIVVGTAALRGEDMPAKGAVTVFEIQTVVPDPERPESGIRLHALSREETRGAITAVESFPGGLLGTAQGQKLMLRGLKEDGSCLPVAFLDAQTHTLGLRSLLRTGLWLAADAAKGVWLGAFTEEPYKLTVLGKSRARLALRAAEFLPFDDGLSVVVADAARNLHCLQYDPENARSLSGARLLHRGTFHLARDVMAMRLVPSSLAPLAAQHAAMSDGSAQESAQQQQQQLYHILITTTSGALGQLTPLDEPAFRRLSALQAQLTPVLEHGAGLNPRAHRHPGTDGRGAVVDAELLRRIGEVGAARRGEVLGRAGVDGWGWRGDAEVLFGGGLGWL